MNYRKSTAAHNTPKWKTEVSYHEKLRDDANRKGVKSRRRPKSSHFHLRSKNFSFSKHFQRKRTIEFVRELDKYQEKLRDAYDFACISNDDSVWDSVDYYSSVCSLMKEKDRVLTSKEKKHLYQRFAK